MTKEPPMSIEVLTEKARLLFQECVKTEPCLLSVEEICEISFGDFYENNNLTVQPLTEACKASTLAKDWLDKQIILAKIIPDYDETDTTPPPFHISPFLLPKELGRIIASARIVTGLWEFHKTEEIVPKYN